MIRFVRHDATGWITQTGVCQDDDLSLQGADVLASDTAIEGIHYIQDGAVKPLPPRPSPAHTWRGEAIGWADMRTLAECRATQVIALKGARDAAIAGGMTWDGSTFDTDETSQSRLLGAFVASQSQSFQPVTWRLADNTWRVLDATDMAGVWAALQTHLRTQFTTFGMLEVQVATAQTNAEVESVVWSG